ncbi:hypothetical protein BH10BDE1_BH10BDE1_04990 [soil metagenome]
MARPLLRKHLTKMTFHDTTGFACSRYERLEERILAYFGESEPEDAHHEINSPFEGFVVELFEVEEIFEDDVRLNHFMSHRLFDPVVFPPGIHEMLAPGDLFMISLGLQGGQWHVTWMSPMHH